MNDKDKKMLHPCPFCGESDGKNLRFCHDFGRMYIRCRTCFTQGPGFELVVGWPDSRISDAQKKAADAWNQRAPAPHAYAILCGNKLIKLVNTSEEAHQGFAEMSEQQMNSVTLLRYDKAYTDFTKKKQGVNNAEL